MELDDLKDEIVSHLADLSGLIVNEAKVETLYGYMTGQDDETITIWTLSEDPDKAQESEWIIKAPGGDVGQIILQGTKLYFKRAFGAPYPYPAEERMFLADLIAPDSFDEAIEQLKQFLKVANLCKPPGGVFIPGMGFNAPPF